eukprot:RCo041842
MSADLKASLATLQNDKKDPKALRTLCGAVASTPLSSLTATMPQILSTLTNSLTECLKVSPPAMELVFDVIQALSTLAADEAARQRLASSPLVPAVVFLCSVLGAMKSPVVKNGRNLEHLAALLLATLSVESTSQNGFAANGAQQLETILGRMEAVAPAEPQHVVFEAYSKALANFVRYGTLHKLLDTCCGGQLVPRLLTIVESAPRVLTKVCILAVLNALLAVATTTPGLSTHTVLYNEGSIGLTIDILVDAMRCLASGLPSADVLMRSAALFLSTWPSDAAVFSRNAQRNIFEEGGGKAALEAIRVLPGDAPMVTYLLRMLANITAKDHETNVVALMDFDLLAAVKAVLKKHTAPPNEEVLVACARLLVNIGHVGEVHRAVHSAQMVVALYDSMEKLISMHAFQTPCFEFLHSLWKGQVVELKQEIVDEGGMNLLISFLSSAMERVEVLKTGFPLLHSMVKHAITDPSPDPPLSDAEVQLLIGVMVRHSGSSEILLLVLEVLMVLVEDKKGNKMDVLNQKTIETLHQLIRGQNFSDAHCAAVIPVMLQFFAKICADAALAPLAVTHDLLGCLNTALRWVLRSGATKELQTCLSMVQGLAASQGADPALVFPSLVAGLSDAKTYSMLTPAMVDGLWELLWAGHQRGGSGSALLQMPAEVGRL